MLFEYNQSRDGVPLMKSMTGLMLIACLALPFAACKKDDAPKAEAAPLAAPAGEDAAQWRAYVSDVVTRNMGGITNSPYVYLLPGESTPDFQDQYDRLGEKVSGDVARGIVKGNMLAYASPASAKIADLVIAAFTTVEPDTMKGVRVLFIGDAVDSARVKAAAEPAGVEYVFVEAK